MISVIVYLQRAMDLVMVPLDRLGPAWSILVSSTVITALGLVVYKYTSNQEGIKTAKDRIKGHFFEVWLYIDDLGSIVRAQGGIFSNGGRYLGYALVPLLVMLLPVLVILVNLEYRYGIRPLQPGEEFILKVALQGSAESDLDQLRLDLPAGVHLLAGPVRIRERNPQTKERKVEADWRLRADQAGAAVLQLQLGNRAPTAHTVLVAASGRPRLNPVRSAELASALLDPPLEPLPAGSAFKAITVAYPEAEVSFFGWQSWWVWPFMAVMLIAAFALRGVIGVEF